ncbi:3-ketoacyl-CoA thiolase 2, peroxisomal [Stylosanthes scabra]|uniref:acetyl-CoA C-acyltransferase n=1 Tax=Stylosanthes scabra TaxID=79078 RepID=A0ABU6TPJ6_9FABA|nr:3-ketoacyl-CoA thiolase 2, peroxisomal [Stylosanthes scabra]
MEKAINRQKVLLHHLNPSSSNADSSSSSSISASACLAGDSAAYQRTGVFGDDVVIVAAYRTAICKAKRGGFKDTPADDLLAPVLKAVVEKTNVNPSEVGDIVVGSVLAPGALRATECRMAAFYAGFPDTVPVRTVNRQCSSGLQAVADVAASIRAGFYEIGIGAGLESMSTNAMGWDGDVNPKVKEFEQARNCLLPMGVTSENVAQRFGVSRKEQDQAAVSDGAGAVLLMKRSTAMQKGLPILGVFRSFSAVGVDPAIMGVGPAAAIPVAVKAAGLELDYIDLFEINEAFASQFVYCRNKLGLDAEKINVNGGAMALGHPLGATGARCTATLLHEMKRRGKDCRFGVVSMCIGTGMGAAAVFERGDGVDELSNARKGAANNLLSKDAR